jgi:hypothetical protein
MASSSYPKNWQKYDLCIKCPYNSQQQDISPELVTFLNHLSKIVGARYICGFVSDYDRQFTILIRAGSKFLYNKAFQESWELLVDPDIAGLVSRAGNPSYFIDPFIIPFSPYLSSLQPFQYIYAPFKNDKTIQHLYWCKRGHSSPFDKSLRIKMLWDLFANNNLVNFSGSVAFKDILEHNSGDRSSNDPFLYNISTLKENHIINDIFAVHEFSELENLSNQVFSWKGFSLPYDKIREYFGERIALDISYMGKIFRLIFSCISDWISR